MVCCYDKTGDKKQKNRRNGAGYMEIQKTAIAGTLESSDAQVTVEPSESGLELWIESVVMNQYGRQIKETVLQTLKQLEVESGKIAVVDKGALECTLIARVQCAVYRSCEAAETKKPWGVL